MRLILALIGLIIATVSGSAYASCSSYTSICTTAAEAQQQAIAESHTKRCQTSSTVRVTEYMGSPAYQAVITGPVPSCLLESPLYGTPWRWVEPYTCPDGSQPGYYPDNTTNSLCRLTNNDCDNRNNPSMDAERTMVNMPAQGVCVAGCMLKPVSPSVTSTVGSYSVTTAIIKYSGTCPPGAVGRDAVPSDTAPDNDQCIPAGAGQTMCVRDNGERNCYTATTGREICWTPTETGDKSDGPLQQTRNAGASPIAPSPQLPNGDSLQQSGTPMTTVTYNQTTNITTTTTTTNYTTVNGTTPPAPPGGQPNGAPEDKSKAPNGSSGGGDCASPPINSGDALLSQIATQSWLIRCGSTLSDANADGVPDYLGLSGDDVASLTAQAGAPDPADASLVGTDIDHTVDALDQSGFGWSRTCPVPPPIMIGSTVISFASWAAICDYLQIAGYLVLLIAGLASLRIIAGA